MTIDPPIHPSTEQFRGFSKPATSASCQTFSSRPMISFAAAKHVAILQGEGMASDHPSQTHPGQIRALRVPSSFTTCNENSFDPGCTDDGSITRFSLTLPL